MGGATTATVECGLRRGWILGMELDIADGSGEGFSAGGSRDGITLMANIHSLLQLWIHREYQHFSFFDRSHGFLCLSLLFISSLDLDSVRCLYSSLPVSGGHLIPYINPH